MNEFTSCLEITQILIELSRGLSISCIDEFQDNKLWEWLVISLKWNESAATEIYSPRVFKNNFWLRDRRNIRRGGHNLDKKCTLLLDLAPSWN